MAAKQKKNQSTEMRPPLQTAIATRTSVQIKVHTFLAVGLTAAAGVVGALSILVPLATFQYSSFREPVLVESPRSLNAKVQNAYKDYATAGDETTKSQKLDALTEVLQRRKIKLQLLADVNPDSALGLMTPDLHDNLPESVQALVETKRSVTGTATVAIEDGISTEKMHYTVVTDDNQSFAVHWAGMAPSLQTGDRVSVVEAYALGDMVVASGDTQATSSEQNIIITPAVTTPAAQQRKVAVILFNFQNDPRQTMTTDQARAVMFTNATSISNYYKETSNNAIEFTGKVRTDGDVFGWYTIPVNAPTSTSGCTPETWGQKADAVAAKAGVDLSGYDHIVYTFPLINNNFSVCTWAGFAQIGGVRSWSHGAPGYFSLRITGHEMGHNLGLQHAEALRCTNGGQVVSYSSTCNTISYGDIVEIMDNDPSELRHIAPYRAAYLGWMPTSAIKNVTTSGTYTLGNYNDVTQSVRAIRIPTSIAGQYFYLEFRQPSGSFDNFAPTANAVNGLIVRLGFDYSLRAITKLLDMTPETTDVSFNEGFRDAALLVGKTFTDDQTGTSITLDSIANGAAQVNVTFTTPTCNRAAPTLTIASPQSTTAGTTSPAYSMTLTNHDNAACGPTTFTLGSSLPTGWTAEYVPASVTITPGASYTLGRKTTVPITENPGTYTLTTTVTGAATEHAISGLSSFTVLVPDLTPPTVSITSPTDGSTLPSKGKVTVAATASDASGILSITLKVDNAVVKTCTNTTTCSYNWNMNAQISKGTHTITATAVDKSPNTQTTTTSITVTK